MVRQKNACRCHDSAALTSHFPASRSPTRESVLSKTRVFGPTVPAAASSANRSRDTRSMASPSRYSTGALLTSSTGRAFVDADQDELVVPQVASRGQRHAVRHPLIDEGVGLFEHPGALRGSQRAFCGKNPQSRIRRKLIEGDTGHDLNIVPRGGFVAICRSRDRRRASCMILIPTRKLG